MPTFARNRHPRPLIPRSALGAALTLALLAGGCVSHGPIRTKLAASVDRPAPGVIVFLCDGLCADLVEQGCREGWLPNIDRHFREVGARVESAVTVVPSITYAAITSIVTGVTPAQHRVPGNRWFDPERRLFRDYATIPTYQIVNEDFAVPTVYERLRPHYSVSIQSAHHFGVSRNIANWAQSGVRWFFGAYTGVDALSMTTIGKVAQEANDHGRWPALLMCYAPGVDSVGHLHGPDSPEYRAAVENFDQHLGRVHDWLAAEGLLDSTYLVLVSDHGMVEVRDAIDLLPLLRDEWGRTVTRRLLQGGTRRSRAAYFDRFDTVLADHDGRRGSLHFRGPDGWDAPPVRSDVVALLTNVPPAARLWAIEGIELVAFLESGDVAHVASARGRARIERRRSEDDWVYRYVPTPDDVLGYVTEPANPRLPAFVAAGFHDSRAWLRAAHQEPFPEVVPDLIALLHERRFGDVLLFAAPGYSFINERGGHGGLSRAEMRVPLMIAGPGIGPGTTLDTARTVDLVPTIVELVTGVRPDDRRLAGESLVPRLKLQETAARCP